MAAATALSELAGGYTLDLARTRIGFVARHTIGPEVRGRFDEFTGDAQLDGADLSNPTVDIAIQAASIQTGNRLRDKYLRDKYLDVADHPTITFTAGEVKQLGTATFTLTGDLTIRGVTNPITVRLELASLSEHRVDLRGRATINRKHWGVRWAAAAGLVSKIVELDLDVAAIRRPDPDRPTTPQ